MFKMKKQSERKKRELNLIAKFKQIKNAMMHLWNSAATCNMDFMVSSFLLGSASCCYLLRFFGVFALVHPWIPSRLIDTFFFFSAQWQCNRFQCVLNVHVMLLISLHFKGYRWSILSWFVWLFSLYQWYSDGGTEVQWRAKSMCILNALQTKWNKTVEQILIEACGYHCVRSMAAAFLFLGCWFC